MILVGFWIFCVRFTLSAGNDQLQPGLIRELYNVFNNLSNLALMPHLMETADCRHDSEIYREAFLQNKMWAAKMFDANGRLSLGILKRNLHQLGNVEQCVLSSASDTTNVEGKLCLVKIYLQPTRTNTFVNEIWEEAYNMTLYTTRPYEENAIPANNVILSTLCVPSSCTTLDITTASRKVLSIFNHTKFGLEAHVDNLNEKNCVVKREYFADEISIIYFGRIFIIIMFVLVSCASLIDAFLLPNVENHNDSGATLVKSFSFLHNWKKFSNVVLDEESMGCLNGLRCITYYILFLLHHSLKLGLLTIDQSDMLQIFRCPLVSAVTKSSFLVLDAMVFLSGISHSYKVTKFLLKKDIKSILKSMLYKYLRLLMFFSIFFCIQSTSIHKTKLHLFYTPTKEKPNIWSIILCFENLCGISNMFFAPAHTFYTDIQLYFIGCITLILTTHYKNKMKLFFLFAFSSLFCRSLYLYFHPEIQGFVTFGIPLNTAIDTMQVMYATPFSRLPFYMSGIALGYYFRTKSDHDSVILSPFQQKIGWLLAIFGLCVAILCQYPIDLNYKYNSFDGAVVTFIVSFSSLIFLIWLVWYCEFFKNSSIVYRFFAADKFVILNKTSTYFSALHLYVVCKCFTNSRLLFEFKLSEVLGLDYLLVTILLCIYIIIFIQLPLKNTWNYLLIKKDTTKLRMKHE